MPGFLKATAIVAASGVFTSFGVLKTLPYESLRGLPLIATMPVRDLPPAPCARQFWPNTDRACQSWTLPHRHVARLLLLERTLASATDDSVTTTGAHSTSEDSAAKPVARKSRAAYARATAGRVARSDDVSHRIWGTAHMADGTQGRITLWPTSREDAYRSGFSERRNRTPRVFALFGTPQR